MITLKNEEIDKTLVMETIAVTWPELFEDFRNFLKGCGFILPEGDIIVEELMCDECQKLKAELGDLKGTTHKVDEHNVEDVLPEVFEIELEKPILITKPGMYKAVNGEPVTITQTTLTGNPGDWYGYVGTVWGWWEKDGTFYNGRKEFNVVGKLPLATVNHKNIDDLE